MSTEKEYLEILKNDIELQIHYCEQQAKLYYKKHSRLSYMSYQGRIIAYTDTLSRVERCIERIIRFDLRTRKVVK